MKIDTKDLLAAYPQLAKNPSLTVALFALSVPMVMLYGATKFVSAPLESLILFGALSALTLSYSAWVYSSFKGGSDAEFDEKS